MRLYLAYPPFIPPRKQGENEIAIKVNVTEY